MATVYPIVILPSGDRGIPIAADVLVINGELTAVERIAFTAGTGIRRIQPGATDSPGSGDPGATVLVQGGTGSIADSGVGAGSGGPVRYVGGTGGPGGPNVGEKAGEGGDVLIVGGVAGVDGGAGGESGGFVIIEGGAPSGAGAYGEVRIGVETPAGDMGTSVVAIGRSGLTITVKGAFNYSLGAFSLSANGASTMTTSAGALTITGAAASTWKTAGGLLTIEGAAGIQLNGSSATSYLTIGVVANQLVVQAGRVLATTGTGNINLPNNGSARFQIEGVAVTQFVTAANLAAITDGSLIGNANEAGSQHNHRSTYVLNSWARANVAAGLTDSALEAFNSAALGAYQYVAAYRGDVIGLTVSLSEAVTAGDLTVKVFLNNVDTGFQVVLSSPNKNAAVQFSVGDIPYTGDLLDIRISTTAGFTPITTDIVAGLIFSEFIT